MKLTKDRIPDYAQIARSAPWGDKQLNTPESLAASLDDGRLIRFLEYRGERPSAIAVIENFFADFYVLGLVLSPDLPGAGAVVLRESIEEAKARGGAMMAIRVVEDSAAPPLNRLLSDAGFRLKNTRVEYRAPIAELPDETGSPIRWEPLPDLSETSIACAGDLLERTGEGDPDFGEDDDGAKLIRGYLEDPVLTHDRNCIHVGYLGEEIFGIVIAQVNPQTKWARLTYMGMLPQFRGRGLGRWVHRHGFAMLREQGGGLYHGGTLDNNVAMNALFRRHGCQEYRRMKEWELRLRD